MMPMPYDISALFVTTVDVATPAEDVCRPIDTVEAVMHAAERKSWPPPPVKGSVHDEFVNAAKAISLIGLLPLSSVCIRLLAYGIAERIACAAIYASSTTHSDAVSYIHYNYNNLLMQAAYQGYLTDYDKAERIPDLSSIVPHLREMEKCIK